MAYKNPLKIFTKDQIEIIRNGGVKEVKKELQLRFQFDNTATIKLNGREVDKTQLNEIFDSLGSDLELHSYIINNRLILKFLEEGYLAFFRGSSKKDNEITEDLYEDLTELMVEHLQKPILNCVEHLTINTVIDLEGIYAFTSSLDANKNNKAYQLAYTFLEDKVSRLNQNITTPFYSDKALAFTRDAIVGVEVLMAKVFKYMPSSFTIVDRDYSLWCHNAIVVEALQRQGRLGKFGKREQKTVVAASKIAMRYHNDAIHTEIQNRFGGVLGGNQKSSDDDGSSFVIKIIIFIILLMIRFAACN